MREQRKMVMYLAALVVCSGIPDGANPLLLSVLGTFAFLAHRRASQALTASRAPRWPRTTLCGLQRIIEFDGEEAVWNYLHFTAADVRRIADRLLPNRVELHDHHGSVSGIDALTTLLYRLVDPGTLLVHERVLGFPDWKQSDIIHTTAYLLVIRHGALLKSSNWLTPQRLANYADAIQQNGMPSETIVGFIDGTRRRLLIAIDALKPTCLHLNSSKVGVCAGGGVDGTDLGQRGPH